MTVSKTYRLKFLSNVTMPFFIDGVEHSVAFVGFYGSKGLFTTSNEKLQKAMEEDKAFNKVYKLLTVSEQKSREELLAERKVKEEAEVESKDSAEQEESKNTESSETSFKVKNIQEANALSKRLFGKDAPSFRLSEKVVEFFKSKGYSLSFE